MEVSYHVLLGRPWLHKHRLVPSTYHQYVKGRLNGRMIHITANQLPFEQADSHLVETMFYDQWALFGESSVAKPRGTFAIEAMMLPLHKYNITVKSLPQFPIV